ncbi:MAG: TIGR00282 family metallophosphoesterase [Zavarzinella sp.]
MKVLFIGDIVGSPGVSIIRTYLPMIRRRFQLDFVVANAENAANSGSGLSPSIYRQLRDSGVDAITMGDHIYRRSEIISILNGDHPIVKPANYPPQSPGKEYVVLENDHGGSLVVCAFQGRTFMKSVDCPYAALERLLPQMKVHSNAILVDFHAEATGDKYVMAHHAAGRVSAVLGTHTHVPTADEQILPGGTAFISDVGMTGPHDSILGRRADRVLATTTSFIPSMFDVASGDVRISGAVVRMNSVTGKADQIQRIQWSTEQLAEWKTEAARDLPRAKSNSPELPTPT